MPVLLPTNQEAQMLVRANSGGATAAAIRAELAALSWISWRRWADPFEPGTFTGNEDYRVRSRTYPAWWPVSQCIPAVVLDGDITWDPGYAEDLAETCATEQAIVVAVADSGVAVLTEINLATAAVAFAAGADYVALCGCSYSRTWHANKVGSGSPYELPATDPHNLFREIGGSDDFDPYSLCVRADYAAGIDSRVTLKMFKVPKP